MFRSLFKSAKKLPSFMSVNNHQCMKGEPFTFTEYQIVKDEFGMQDVIRKEHCFVIDDCQEIENDTKFEDYDKYQNEIDGSERARLKEEIQNLEAATTTWAAIACYMFFRR